LFTDIEGSTQHWERTPEAMRTALAMHNQIVGEALAAHGGVVFKMVGEMELRTAVAEFERLGAVQTGIIAAPTE
jgi:class 3 adenylate cyclase